MGEMPRVLLHGADYNPDQWLDRPDILEADLRMMKKAGFNCVSLAIFAWAALEPAEGRYEFGWLGEIIDKLHANGVHTILATPGGARPAWLAQKYPEVLRVAGDGVTRNHFGARHNHCFTSPVYREKVAAINKKLAEKFGKHPAVILWHLNNEYGGECYCELCQNAFRGWVKNRYGTLEALNKAWWTGFWSHTVTDWSQVEPPFANGEQSVQGLLLDWKRFTTHQTVDFCAAEKQAVRDGGSDLPVTANMMEYFELDYHAFRDVLDVISWDSYPRWRGTSEKDIAQAVRHACIHDIMRGIKRQPFLLMESTPSVANWQEISRLKRPGAHMREGMLAISHGSDSVQYFQWRKSRGSFEKFHGAVVSHDGRDDTRVFADVEAMGERLKGLAGLRGTMPKAKVAIVYDYENEWALRYTSGPRNIGLKYFETVLAHYEAFWRLGITTDIVDAGDDISGYKLVVAPMLYLQSDATAESLNAFVDNGGTLVAGCLHGVVDETDLCRLGDAPVGQTDLFGLRVEEVDSLEDGEENRLLWQGREYMATGICELIVPGGCHTEGEYARDFYTGCPALTRNRYGAGTAWYIATQPEKGFYRDFYRMLAQKLELPRALQAELPPAVVAAARGGLVFVQNWSEGITEVRLYRDYTDAESGEMYEGRLVLGHRDTAILKAES